LRRPEALPFIFDDYRGALARARKQKRPLFVWIAASWDHSGRSERASVFVDSHLERHAGRFVWLDVDTDRGQNIAFLERHVAHNENLPRLLVIDSRDEKPILDWTGTAPVDKLELLFEETMRALNASGGEVAQLIARADRLAAERNYKEAISAYREVLGRTSGLERDRLLESLIQVLQNVGESEACSSLARAEAPTLTRGTAFANVVNTGLACTAEFSGSAVADHNFPVPAETSWRAPARAVLIPLAEEATRLPALLDDDRSAVFEKLVWIYEQTDQQAKEKETANRWLDFATEAIARAPSANARAAFNQIVMLAALKTGDPSRAIPALERSERELPSDFNPPERLAIIYRDLRRIDEGLAACERALARVYGTRKIRLLETKADLLAQRGDRAGAQRTLEEARATVEGMAPIQLTFATNPANPANRERALERIKKHLGALARTGP
jgi:tetratricopeptide (TPR) repeat protein